MIFNYARNLDFEQKPDYGYMKKGLKSVLDSIHNYRVFAFDWIAMEKNL